MVENHQEMEMEIYVVRDNKAGTYNTPFFQPTDIHALRAFRAEINRVNDSNYMYLYPEEYDLCHIGTFDEKNGQIAHDQVKLLANGKSLIAKANT